MKKNIMDAIISLQPSYVNEAIIVVGDDNVETAEITWGEATPISNADIQTELDRIQALEDAKPNIADLKASAKAKLIAGEALTEEEANTIVL